MFCGIFGDLWERLQPLCLQGCDAFGAFGPRQTYWWGKEGVGPHRREPRMCSDEQGRTSECIPGLSNMNLGMYSQIERHGDRWTTGDWQIEENWHLGRQISSNCKSPMLCLSWGPAPMWPRRAQRYFDPMEGIWVSRPLCTMLLQVCCMLHFARIGVVSHKCEMWALMSPNLSEGVQGALHYFQSSQCSLKSCEAG